MLMAGSSLGKWLDEGTIPPMHDASRTDDCKTWTTPPAPGGPCIGAGDRVVRYGDGVFVTLGIRDGVLLDAERQLERLRRAADRLGLVPPPLFDDPDDAPYVAAALLEDLGADDRARGTARLQWHAGSGPRGFGRDDVIAGAILDLGPAPGARRPALVVLDEAEAPPPALPRLKTCSALAHVTAARAARALGADDGVRTVDGVVLETPSANLFWLDRGVLRTPAADLPLYAGSVRERVIECALDAGLPVEEGEYAPDDLADVDALLLTNAARGVELAASLDGRVLPEPSGLALALVDAVAARRLAGGIPLGGR